MHAEVRRQLAVVGSLLLLSGSLKSHSTCQMPLPTDPSHRPKYFILKKKFFFLPEVLRHNTEGVVPRTDFPQLVLMLSLN